MAARARAPKSAPPPPPADPARRRRAPEVAREEILLAADRLFRERGPGATGLKDVAQAAGVTHGLVTHYFGAFAKLVRAVWQRRNQLAVGVVLEKVVAARVSRVRAGVPDGGTELEAALGAFVFEYLADPYRADLYVWLRAHDDGGHAEEEKGLLLSALVDFAERELARVREAVGRPMPGRERIEAAVLLVLSAGLGWALGRTRWLAALGRDGDVGADADAAFQRDLWIAVRAVLDRA